MLVTLRLNEIIPIRTVSWPTLKYSANDFKKRRTISKFSSPIELEASTTKNRSSLKSAGHPEPEQWIVSVKFNLTVSWRVLHNQI